MKERIRNILIEAISFKERLNINAAFWKWFGDSKVVDENGDPMIMYHGTNKSFDSFIMKHADSKKLKSPLGLLGFFFTGSSDLASAFSKVRWSKESSKYKRNANVLPCYLSIDSPYMMSTYEFVQLSNRSDDKVRQTRDSLMSNYDGIIVQKPEADEFPTVHIEFPTEQYIAFYPQQIKSIFNRGTWDPNNSDITK